MRKSEGSAIGWTILFCVLVVIPIAIGLHLVITYPVISAIVGTGLAIIVVRYVRVKRRRAREAEWAVVLANSQAVPASVVPTQQATLAAVSRHKSTLALADAIITEHAAELTIRRKQLTGTLSCGVVDDSKWLQEVEFFIDEVIEDAGCDIAADPERLQLVMRMIDTATENHSVSREIFAPDMDPVDFGKNASQFAD